MAPPSAAESARGAGGFAVPGFASGPGPASVPCRPKLPSPAKLPRAPVAAGPAPTIAPECAVAAEECCRSWLPAWSACRRWSCPRSGPESWRQPRRPPRSFRRGRRLRPPLSPGLVAWLVYLSVSIAFVVAFERKVAAVSIPAARSGPAAAVSAPLYPVTKLSAFASAKASR
jgi:hypothetical protein